MATQRRSKLEYADLANTPNDGRRYELLNGALTVSPSAVPHPNAQYDRVAKARRYATLGVPHSMSAACGDRRSPAGTEYSGS